MNAAKAVQQQQLQTVIHQEKVESVMAALLTPAAGVAPVVVKRTGIALSAAFEVSQLVVITY